jgi:CPA2 family monovalent cation:H+ antiporter-2
MGLHGGLYPGLRICRDAEGIRSSASSGGLMSHENSLIFMLTAGFVLAFLFGMGALRLKLSPLLGYLAAGAVVGPFTPGYVADHGDAGQLAEIGVILLMFGVGLHFSPKDLLSVRRVALPGALLQIGLGLAMGWGAGEILGIPVVEALLLGMALSVASTVVVLRVLEARHETKTEIGRIAVGWLVVQDFVVVLALVFLPLFLGKQDLEPGALALQVAWQVAKLAVFVVFMLVVGGRVLPWALVGIAHARSRELFTLGVLAIALGIAWFAYAVFGASFALGAFVAGLVLNGTHLGHNAAERSLPLRDAFAVLFFVSVGMLFNPMVLLRSPMTLAVVLGIVILAGVGSALLAGSLSRLAWRDTVILAGALPQVGEFSFVLAGLAVSLGAMSRETQAVIVAAAILSIAVNPILMWLADRAAGAPPAEARGA